MQRITCASRALENKDKWPLPGSPAQGRERESCGKLSGGQSAGAGGVEGCPKGSQPSTQPGPKHCRACGIL